MTRSRLYWGIIGGLLLVASGVLHLLARADAPAASRFVILELLAGLVYLLAVWQSYRNPASLSLWYILSIALGCRLLVLSAPVVFDDDIHRYLWDGKVLARGVNPYRYAPLANELWMLRDENWTRVGYPQIHTLYPPLAECLFAGAWLLGLRTIFLLKCLFLLFDLANILLIVLLLTRLQLPGGWVIAYAWSPLAVKEFANSGHLEPVLLFFMLLTLVGVIGKKPRFQLAGAWWGLAILTKFVPLLWAPLLWRVGRWRMVLPAMLVIGIGYLPFLGAGRQLISGAGMYSRYWTFNDGIFAVLSALQRAILPGLARLPINPLRVLVMVVTAGYAVYVARQCRVDDQRALPAAGGNILAGCLLLSPTVDPWYICWLLPFLCFTPNAGLLLWTVTCQLSYLYYLHGTFPVWIPLAEYLPVALVLLGMMIKRQHSALPVAAQDESTAIRRQPSQT